MSGAEPSQHRGSGAVRARHAQPAPAAPDPLPSPAVDSHCHLDLLEAEVADVVAQAAAAGVTRLLTVGVDAASSRWQAAAAAAHDPVWAAVAIHPNDVAAAAPGDLDEIAGLAALPQVRAVGESGLDHFRTESAGWPAQEAALRAHAEIATRVGKPLVVHDRDAHADLLRVLDDCARPPAVVVHCFSGDEFFAAECLRRGFVLSFAGTVTFASAHAVRAAARTVPGSQLLAETDAPFLTPTPHRGAANTPAQVARTLRALALVRDQPLDVVCAATSATAERLFGPFSG